MNPYVGLQPFGEAERALYFGREPEAQRLINRLFAGRITVLHAPFGTGKTSFLRVRIVPQLREQGIILGTVENWEDPQTGLLEAFAGGPELDAKLEAASDSLAVLVLDQFEQFLIRLYDGQRPPETRFLQELQRLLDAHDNLFVMISLRDEFFAALELLRSYGFDVFANSFRLEDLSEGDVRAAIVGPAEKFGKSFEEEFLIRFIADLKAVNRTWDRVSTTSSAVSFGASLPFLQIACRKLWEITGDDPRITGAMYDQIGGLVGISRSWVRDSTARFATNAQRITAAKILRNSAIAGVKIPIRLPEFAQKYGLRPERSRRVLEILQERQVMRLRMSTDREDGGGAGHRTWELAHDALFPVLDQWARGVLERSLRLRVVVALLFSTLLVGGAVGFALLHRFATRSEWEKVTAGFAALQPFQVDATPHEYQQRWYELEGLVSVAQRLDGHPEASLELLRSHGLVVPPRRMPITNRPSARTPGERDAIVVEVDIRRVPLAEDVLARLWRGRVESAVSRGIALPANIRLLAKEPSPDVEPEGDAVPGKSETIYFWYPTSRNWSLAAATWPLAADQMVIRPKKNELLDLLSPASERVDLCSPDSGRRWAAYCDGELPGDQDRPSVVVPRWSQPFLDVQDAIHGEVGSEEILIELLFNMILAGDLGEPHDMLRCSAPRLQGFDAQTLAAMSRSEAKVLVRAVHDKKSPLPLFVAAASDLALGSEPADARSSAMLRRAEELREAWSTGQPPTHGPLVPDDARVQAAMRDADAEAANICSVYVAPSVHPVLELALDVDPGLQTDLERRLYQASLDFYVEYGVIPPLPNFRSVSLREEESPVQPLVWGVGIAALPPIGRQEGAVLMDMTMRWIKNYWAQGIYFWLTREALSAEGASGEWPEGSVSPEVRMADHLAFLDVRDQSRDRGPSQPQYLRALFGERRAAHYQRLTAATTSRWVAPEKIAVSETRDPVEAACVRGGVPYAELAYDLYARHIRNPSAEWDIDCCAATLSGSGRLAEAMQVLREHPEAVETGTLLAILFHPSLRRFDRDPRLYRAIHDEVPQLLVDRVAKNRHDTTDTGIARVKQLFAEFDGRCSSGAEPQRWCARTMLRMRRSCAPGVCDGLLEATRPIVEAFVFDQELSDDDVAAGMAMIAETRRSSSESRGGAPVSGARELKLAAELTLAEVSLASRRLKIDEVEAADGLSRRLNDALTTVQGKLLPVDRRGAADAPSAQEIEALINNLQIARAALLFRRALQVSDQERLVRKHEREELLQRLVVDNPTAGNAILKFNSLLRVDSKSAHEYLQNLGEQGYANLPELRANAAIFLFERPLGDQSMRDIEAYIAELDSEVISMADFRRLEYYWRLRLEGRDSLARGMLRIRQGEIRRDTWIVSDPEQDVRVEDEVLIVLALGQESGAADASAADWLARAIQLPVGDLETDGPLWRRNRLLLYRALIEDASGDREQALATLQSTVAPTNITYLQPKVTEYLLRVLGVPSPARPGVGHLTR